MIFKEIDEHFRVDDIAYKGEKVWPYLRIVYGFKMVSASLDKKVDKKAHFVKRFIKMASSIFYGATNWFKRYDYVVYGNTDGKKLIDGRYHDRLVESLLDQLGHENVLFIEQFNQDKFYDLSKLHHKYTVSYSWIELVTAVFSRCFFWSKYTNDILDDMNKTLKIEVNYDQLLKHFSLSVYFNMLILRLYKPKVVFITNYAHKSVVKAAKNLNIPIVELQHGVINAQHHGYNMTKSVDYNFYPDYILTMGEKEKEFFERESCYIKNDKHVFVVGSYYLDWINSNFDPQVIRGQYSRFKTLVSVTLQWTVAEEMIRFIETAALENLDTLFILIPRRSSDLKTFNKSSDNIVVLNEYNCYEIVKSTDFHVTSYSSCGYEAPALGIQNIFVDLKYSAQSSFDSFIKEHKYNHFVSSIKEFNQVLEKKSMITQEEIQYENREYIVPQHKRKVSKFIDYIKNEIEKK